MEKGMVAFRFLPAKKTGQFRNWIFTYSFRILALACFLRACACVVLIFNRGQSRAVLAVEASSSATGQESSAGVNLRSLPLSSKHEEEEGQGFGLIFNVGHSVYLSEGTQFWGSSNFPERVGCWLSWLV